MKKYLSILVVFICFFQDLIAQNAKIISDFTIVYDVIVDDAKADAKMMKAMNGATKILYNKGSKSRSELITPNFQQSVIYDSKSDSTVVLRELGNNKYISYPDQSKRDESNKKYEGIVFNNTDETKTILGYECKKVVAILKDGSTYNVFYTPSVISSNKEYQYQFRDLPGFVLEYEAEAEGGKLRVKYSATKITLSPVSSAKFDIPKTGYRVL